MSGISDKTSRRVYKKFRMIWSLPLPMQTNKITFSKIVPCGLTVCIVFASCCIFPVNCASWVWNKMKSPGSTWNLATISPTWPIMCQRQQITKNSKGPPQEASFLHTSQTQSLPDVMRNALRNLNSGKKSSCGLHIAKGMALIVSRSLGVHWRDPKTIVG